MPDPPRKDLDRNARTTPHETDAVLLGIAAIGATALAACGSSGGTPAASTGAAATGLAVREHGHRDHGPDHDRSGDNVDDLDDLGNDHDLG